MEQPPAWLIFDRDHGRIGHIVLILNLTTDRLKIYLLNPSAYSSVN